jgi:hypothetical protein
MGPYILNWKCADPIQAMNDSYLFDTTQETVERNEWLKPGAILLIIYKQFQ